MSTTLHARPTSHPAQPELELRTRAEKRPRDPWFDNAKMLLVTLVVVGHGWTLLPHNLVDAWLYDFLYLWHVPAFVMVTGYLSRSFTWSRRDLRRLMTSVALPYMIFEAALAAFRFGVGGEEMDMLFADPHWPMWYLAALLLWRLATPPLKSLPGALPLAVVVSLLGGLATTEVLDVSRATGLLPFFVMGLLARREHLDALRDGRFRAAAWGVLGTAFLLCSLVDGRMRTEWMYWRSGYAELGVTALEGMAVRFGLLVAAGLVALSFLTVVPRTYGWFSRLGAATLVVYLFHGFFVKGAEYAGLASWTAENPGLGLLATSGGAVVLSLTLAAPPVARRLKAVVDPVGTRHARRQM